MWTGRSRAGTAVLVLAAVGAAACDSPPVRGAGAGPPAGSTAPASAPASVAEPPATAPPTGPPAPLVPGGRYRPVTGLCGRIDLTAVRRLIDPVATTQDRNDGSPGSYSGTFCDYRAEQPPGHEPATVVVIVAAQLYGDARAAASPYDGTARTPSMTCPPAGYTRRAVTGLGSRALSEQCSDPGHQHVMYKLLVQADNLCLDVAVLARGERQQPRPAVTAGLTRGVVDSVLALLDGR